MKMANDNPARHLSPEALSSPAWVGFLLCACLTMAGPACADTVETMLPSGITARANFHAGLPALPAVLVLHGFLQTGHSPPMSSLAGNLASRGYTVLTPTMSLNIDRRSQSMACDAAHTHTMEGEVAEVGYWVSWLGKKGYQNIVLAGFSSTGNHSILSYLTRASHPAVKKAVLVNPNPIYTKDQDRRKTRHVANETKLSKFTMGYCKNNFTATADSYHSYAQYDESRVLDLLKQTPVPTEVILGTADNVLPANWAERIRTLQSLARIRTIQNANHFFDGIQEFYLADEVESILKTSRPNNP